MLSNNRSINEQIIYGWLPSPEQFQLALQEVLRLPEEDRKWFERNQATILLQLIRAGFYRWYLPRKNTPLRSISIVLDNWNIVFEERLDRRLESCISPYAYLRIKADSWYDQYRLPHWMHTILCNHGEAGRHGVELLSQGWDILPEYNDFHNLHPGNPRHCLDAVEECYAVCRAIMRRRVNHPEILLDTIDRPHNPISVHRYSRRRSGEPYNHPLLPLLSRRGYLREGLSRWRDLAIGEQCWVFGELGWACQKDLNQQIFLCSLHLVYEQSAFYARWPTKASLLVTKLPEKRAILQFPAYYPFEPTVSLERRVQLFRGIEMSSSFDSFTELAEIV